MPTETRETADVVVVGARVAGSPAATELAKAGRKVIVLDAATFPSDTLSTHVIFPTCVAELSALGVLEPLLATGSPTMPDVLINHGGVNVHWHYTAVDGFNYGMCPRRTTLDNILVETARKAGAEVREATKITGLDWKGGRVSGVHWQDRKGKAGTIATKLVIGADGRRSTVAELVGAKEPYRRDENGRGLVFMYFDDPYPADSPERRHLFQWRIGDTLGMYFPTCDNGGLVLFMPPREQVADFGQDLVHWNERVDRYPLLKERIAGGAPRTKVRKAADPFSYFRRSSGPGWALVGNAGQVCISPDYVMVPRGKEAEFATLARDAARKLYPRLAGNPDATAVINDAHYQRLSGYVADAEAKGARVHTAADVAESRGERKLPLTVVLDPTDDMKVLQEEIFGPVLPVLGYASLGEAVEYVNGRPRPLALYLFSNQAATQAEVLGKTTSGGVSLNDTMLHYLQDDLPFGGVGPSGMGSYHGREGFDTFSHMKAVFRQRGLGSRTGAQLLYPPYGPIAGLLIRLMRRI